MLCASPDSLHLNLQNLKHFIQPGFRLQGLIVKFGLCEWVSYMLCPGQQQGQTSRTPASDMKFTNWASFWECGVDLEISIPCPSMSPCPFRPGHPLQATSQHPHGIHHVHWKLQEVRLGPYEAGLILLGFLTWLGILGKGLSQVGPLGPSLTNHQQKAKSWRSNFERNHFGWTTGTMYQETQGILLHSAIAPWTSNRIRVVWTCLDMQLNNAVIHSTRKKGNVFSQNGTSSMFIHLACHFSKLFIWRPPPAPRCARPASRLSDLPSSLVVELRFRPRQIQQRGLPQDDFH